MTAFLVVITPTGSSSPSPTSTPRVRLKRAAGFDGFQRAGHLLVDDALAIKTATIAARRSCS
ncbi:hypothetical protein ACFCYC_32735 [Streptomyces sp. NPDC056402]|uniref:hypothetical protein n=1 Tax=Streptomyces sp. NPDC056402 TaxID=3345810 RepID=UPI0035D975B6